MVTDSLKFLTKEMMVLLKDEKWHRFGEFIPISNKIPPEIGQRAYLTSHQGSGYKIQKTLESQAAGGRTILLKNRLRDMVKRNYIFMRGKKEESEYMRNPNSSGPKLPGCPRKEAAAQIAPSALLAMDELKGKIWLTGAEYFAPERKAFGEIRKPGRPKREQGVSVLPILVTMAKIKGKVVLTLGLIGDRIIVKDIK